MVIWILIKFEDQGLNLRSARLTSICHRANNREDPKAIREDEGEASAALLKRFVAAAT